MDYLICFIFGGLFGIIAMALMAAARDK